MKRQLVLFAPKQPLVERIPWDEFYEKSCLEPVKEGDVAVELP